MLLWVLTVGTRHIDTDGLPFDQLVEVVDGPENGQNLADEHVLAADPAERVLFHFSGAGWLLRLPTTGALQSIELLAPRNQRSSRAAETKVYSNATTRHY